MVLIHKHCKNCNKLFLFNRKEKRRKFCSPSCSSIYNNKHRNYDFFKGDKNPAKRLSVRKKISEKLKGRKTPWMIGKNNWNYGGLSEEHKQKVSLSHKGLMSGCKHWNWKGGITNESYGPNWSETLRTIIRKRDKFACAICNKNGFVVHHIDYNKKNNKHNNLITLCRHCHCKTNYKRNIWYIYFKVVHFNEFNIRNLNI
jgi:DNA-directed RNA polymerase subunit M/transcription elongation factor TFIIS